MASRFPYGEVAVVLFGTVMALLGVQAQGQQPREGDLTSPGPGVAENADPLPTLARMLGGAWKATMTSGTSLYDRCYWGPGARSLRVMTEGEDAAGRPWRAIQAYYRHPGRGQIRVWGVNPYAQSVEEGDISRVGERIEAVCEMFQTARFPGVASVRRTLVRRWQFESDDRFRLALLERGAKGELEPLVEWEYTRGEIPRPAASNGAGDAPQFPARLEPLATFRDRTWRTEPGVRGDWVTAGELSVEASFAWVPYADAIHAQVLASRPGGAAEHVLDMYLYHHTGEGELRCLAIAAGGVCEGRLEPRPGGVLEASLSWFASEKETPARLRLEPVEGDGTGRLRLRIEGSGRVLFEAGMSEVPPAGVPAGAPDARRDP